MWLRKSPRRGRDYAVPSPEAQSGLKLAALLMLALLTIPLQQYLNLSVIAVSLTGLLLRPSFTGVAIAFMACVVYGMANYISNRWGDAKLFAEVIRHLRAFKHCRFELLSTRDMKARYGIQPIVELVGNPEAISIAPPARSPLTPDGQHLIRTSDRSWSAARMAFLLPTGHRFLLWNHAPIGSTSQRGYATFSSRNFRFAFLSGDPEPSASRRFMVAHELGHATQPSSIAKYFEYEGLIRVMIALPLLLSCISISWVSTALLLAYVALYSFVRFVLYPRQSVGAHLRDEVAADWFAVWMMPLEELRRLSKNKLSKIIQSNKNTESGGPELVDYRVDVLWKEVLGRLSGDTFNISRAMSQRDGENRQVAPTGSWAVESLMGLLLLALAIFSYQVSDHSIALACLTSAAIAIAAVAITMIAHTRWRRLVATLREAQG